LSRTSNAGIEKTENRPDCCTYAHWDSFEIYAGVCFTSTGLWVSLGAFLIAVAMGDPLRAFRTHFFSGFEDVVTRITVDISFVSTLFVNF
jgi:hypothetical protein